MTDRLLTASVRRHQHAETVVRLRGGLVDPGLGRHLDRFFEPGHGAADIALHVQRGGQLVTEGSPEPSASRRDGDAFLEESLGRREVALLECTYPAQFVRQPTLERQVQLLPERVRDEY